MQNPDCSSKSIFVYFISGSNLQEVLQNGYYSKVHSQNILGCNLFSKVLSDVLLANYTQRYT